MDNKYDELIATVDDWNKIDKIVLREHMADGVAEVCKEEGKLCPPDLRQGTYGDYEVIRKVLETIPECGKYKSNSGKHFCIVERINDVLKDEYHGEAPSDVTVKVLEGLLTGTDWLTELVL